MSDGHGIVRLAHRRDLDRVAALWTAITHHHAHLDPTTQTPIPLPCAARTVAWASLSRRQWISAMAERGAAAVVNYWCRVAFTSTAHAFSKKTHGHPLEQHSDCRNTDEQAFQQDEKLNDRRELPDEATTHAHPSEKSGNFRH